MSADSLGLFGPDGPEPDSGARYRFTPLDLAKKLTEPQTTVPWIVPGYLARGDAAILAGHAGHGKSIISLDLALACTEGGLFLGDIQIASRLKVAIFDEEQHERLVIHRVLRQAAGRGLAPHAVGDLPLTYYSQIGLDLTDEAIRDEFHEVIRREGFELVIIDSLTRVCGRSDMNDAKDAAHLFGTAFAPLARDNVAVVVLHHNRKPSGREDDPQRQHGVRGSSDITAAVSQVLVIEKDVGSDLRTLYHTKCRWEQEQSPRSIAFEGGAGDSWLKVSSSAITADHATFILDLLGAARRDGLLRSSIVDGLARERRLSDSMAERTTTRVLGQLKRQRRAYSKKEGKAARYWARDFTPTEVLKAVELIDG